MWCKEPSHASYRPFVPWESMEQISPVGPPGLLHPIYFSCLDGIAPEARASVVPATVHAPNTHSKKLIPRDHYDNKPHKDQSKVRQFMWRSVTQQFQCRLLQTQHGALRGACFPLREHGDTDAQECDHSFVYTPPCITQHHDS